MRPGHAELVAGSGRSPPDPAPSISTVFDYLGGCGDVWPVPLLPLVEPPPAVPPAPDGCSFGHSERPPPDVLLLGPVPGLVLPDDPPLSEELPPPPDPPVPPEPPPA